MKVFKIIILLMITIFGIKVKALNIDDIAGDKIIKKEYCTNYSEYGELSFPKAEKMGGGDIKLYCQFNNNEQSLNKFKKKFFEQIEYLKEKYLLQEISDTNWKEYYELLINSKDNKYPIEYQNMQAFFDIYENKSINDEIKEYINDYNKSKNKYEKNSLLELIKNTIPEYNDVDNNNYMINKTQSYSMEKGVNYALKYVTKYNSSKYGDLGKADCTNFASQVLENGGYEKVNGLTSLNGWWYKKNGNDFSYSRSWVNAGNFMKRFGVKYSSKDFMKFSKNIKKGYIIGQDIGSDGGYDHMGIVTETTNNYKKYSIDKDNMCYLVEYYDFKVAQHSGKYNLFVSEEDNHWENGIASNCTYGVTNVNYK